MIDNLIHRKIKRTNDLLSLDNKDNNRVTLKNRKQRHKEISIETGA